LECHEEAKAEKCKEKEVWAEETARVEWVDFVLMQDRQDIVYAQNAKRKLRISRESLVFLLCVPNADHRC
jgi:hypothetical protein